MKKEEMKYHHGHECDDSECECHHHEHERDDSECQCHHHEHKHEHNDSECESHHKGKVHISMHDGAIVGSVTCCINLPYDEAILAVKECLQTVGTQIQKNSGFIGHIKGIVESSGSQCRISITDEEEADLQMLDPLPVCWAECACIVFGVSKNELKKIISVSFSEWLEG